MAICKQSHLIKETWSISYNNFRKMDNSSHIEAVVYNFLHSYVTCQFLKTLCLDAQRNVGVFRRIPKLLNLCLGLSLRVDTVSSTY